MSNQGEMFGRDTYGRAVVRPDEGARLRDEGCAKVLDHTSEGWKYAFRCAAVDIMADHGSVTVNDIYERIGPRPAYVHQNAPGAQLRAVATAEGWVRGGSADTVNPAAHKRAGGVTIWVRNRLAIPHLPS